MAVTAKHLMNYGIILNNYSSSFFFCQSGQNHFFLLLFSPYFLKKETNQGDIHSILS